jgi:hypothetical protein
MSQKLGFPYFGLTMNTLIFWIGLIFSLLVYLVSAVTTGQAALLGILEFIGIFITGWSLIGFAVNKDMVEGQRFIALLFALLVLVGLFAVYLVHPVYLSFTV